jgi:hypothetical protein
MPIGVDPGDWGVHGYGLIGDIGTSGVWPLVKTDSASAFVWSEDLDHEVIEGLVDPQVDRYIDGTLVEPTQYVERREIHVHDAPPGHHLHIRQP